MGITTFQNKMRIGDKANSALGREESLGFVPVVQSGTILYTEEGAAKDICVLPAKSEILDIYVDVITAFNGSGTNLLNLGKAGSDDEFAKDLDVSAAGRVLASSDASQLANLVNIGDDQVTLQAIYADQNSNASAGAARITVLYVPGNDLS